jgi:predicted aspartyl protease
MGRVEEEIEVCGTKGSKKVIAIFDSGSTRCLVNPDLVESVGGEYTGYEPVVKLADGREVKVKEVEFSYIEVLGYRRIRARAFALEGLLEQMLIGQDIMQELGVTLKVREEKVVLERGKPSIGYTY